MLSVRVKGASGMGSVLWCRVGDYAWGLGYCIDGSRRFSKVLGRPWLGLVGAVLGLGSVGLEVGVECVCARGWGGEELVRFIDLWGCSSGLFRSL